MKIKRIEATEYAEVASLFDQYRVFYRQASDPKLAESFIRQRLENRESVIFLAYTEENNRQVPAGFTQLYPLFSSVRVQKDWILNDLYVEEAFRKTGIGRQLIQTALSFAREQQASQLQLETATDNLTAQSLYEAMGFRQQSPSGDCYIYAYQL
jgi:ribosomal protein S18 acetylase RimI-like enzyme